MESTPADHRSTVDLFISAICKTERIPKGFSPALSALDNAAENSTGKIFFDHGGFATWLAYFVVSRRVDGSSHFAGQATTSRLIRALEDSSVERRILVVKEVKEGIPPEVKGKFESVLNPPHKRQRTQDVGLHQRPSRQSSTVSERIHDAPTSTPQDDHYYPIRQPLYSNIKDILPSSIVNALKILPLGSRGDPDRVNITMSFPRAEHWGKEIDPQMVLHIESGINHFAWRLFNARIEASNGIQYLVLENGLKIESVNGIFLRGCIREAIPEIFGTKVAEAVQKSLVYTQERREASLTEGVVMQIGRKVEDEATLLLSVAEREGILLKEALWGK